MKPIDFVVAAVVGIIIGLVAGYLTFSMSWKLAYVSEWFAPNMVWSGDWMLWAGGGGILGLGLTYLFRSRKISN